METSVSSATSPICMCASASALSPSALRAGSSVGVVGFTGFSARRRAAGELGVPGPARLVEADDVDLLALLVVLELDRIERGDGGRIVDLRVAEVDDDVLGVA